MLINISIDINAILIAYIVFLMAVLLLFIFFDVNYFINCFIIVVWCGVFSTKRRRIDETIDYYSFCSTGDVDLYLRHMNNGRYIRELDFAKMYFYQKTGLYDILMKTNSVVLQAGSYIQYKRAVPIFTFYKITTKVIFWDEKNIYFQHRFISKDVTTTVVLSRQRILGLNVSRIMNQLLKNDDSYKPEIPGEFEQWIKMSSSGNTNGKNEGEIVTFF